MAEDQMRCLVLLQHQAYRLWQLALSSAIPTRVERFGVGERLFHRLHPEVPKLYPVPCINEFWYKFAKSISEHLVRDGIHLIEDSGTASRFDDKRDILFCNLDAYIVGKEDTEKLSSRYLKA